MKLISSSLVVALAALASACSNPAQGKAQAQVGEAQPAPAAPQAAAAAAAKTYTIAPDTSLIVLKGSKPTRTHTIKVPAFSGTIQVPGDKPTDARISVTIDMTRIQADEARLTGHLLSPDFFDVEKFPTATFTSTAIKAGGDQGASHTITGNFELRGVTKSISFPATVTASPEKVTAKAEFVINRKDWGIVYPGMADDLIRDEVVITLDIDAPPAK